MIKYDQNLKDHILRCLGSDKMMWVELICTAPHNFHQAQFHGVPISILLGYRIRNQIRGYLMLNDIEYSDSEVMSEWQEVLKFCLEDEVQEYQNKIKEAAQKAIEQYS